MVKSAVTVGGSGLVTEDVSCVAYYPAAGENMANNTASANIHGSLGVEIKNARVATLQ